MPLDLKSSLMLTTTSTKNKKELFSEVYQTYYSPFCLYAHRFIDDISTCKDIVSEVFITIWDKVDATDLASESIIAYLKVCVRNRCFNHIKQECARKTQPIEIEEKLPIYVKTPDDIYTLNELYEKLDTLLKKLPKQQMLIFTKSFFEGKTHSVIAEELNISLRSVNRHKQKTLELLRSEMKDFLTLISFYYLLKI